MEATTLEHRHPWLPISIKHIFRINTQKLLSLKTASSRQFLSVLFYFQMTEHRKQGLPDFNFASLGILQITVLASTDLHVAHVKQLLHIHGLVVQFKTK